MANVRFSIGGDEFAVIGSNVARPAEALELAERLVAVFAEPFHVDVNHQLDKHWNGACSALWDHAETRRTVDLGHSSHGPSWIDPAAIRVDTTESPFAARLNRLLQQNRQISDMPAARRCPLLRGQNGHAESRSQ